MPINSFNQFSTDKQLEELSNTNIINEVSLAGAIKSVLSFVKNKLSSVFTKIKFGETKRVKISIPVPLLEAKSAYGKPAGEMVEYLIASTIYDNRQHFNNIILKDAGKEITQGHVKSVSEMKRKQFKELVEKDAKQKDNFAKLFKAYDAMHKELASQLLEDLLKTPDRELCSLTIDLRGQADTGYSKADLEFILSKVDEKTLEETIVTKVATSIKARMSGSIASVAGTQSGAISVLIALATGKSTKELKLNTVEGQLKYIKNLIPISRDDEKAMLTIADMFSTYTRGGASARDDKYPELEKHYSTYYEIVVKLINKLNDNNGKDMVRSILKFSGLDPEEEIHYAAADLKGKMSVFNSMRSREYQSFMNKLAKGFVDNKLSARAETIKRASGEGYSKIKLSLYYNNEYLKHIVININTNSVNIGTIDYGQFL